MLVFAWGAAHILIPVVFAAGFFFGFANLVKAVADWEDRVEAVARARSKRDAERWARRIRPGTSR